MKNKKLGNITVEPVEDPNKPGELYVDKFGWTEHIGVNFTNEAGRWHKGWFPLELWQQLPDAPAGRWPTEAELKAEADRLEAARGAIDPTDQDPPARADYREGAMPHASLDGEARMDPRLVDDREGKR